ncbi:MAG: FGGY family carbohydrate kinase [Pseudomonadota bacterium]
MKYLVGIDGGTQSTKVVIFDLLGNIVCQARQALQPMHMPKPGVAEHPNDDLWQSLRVACARVMQEFPHDPKDILGVGLCTIRCCRAELDATGRLTSPVLSWMDERLSRPYEATNTATHFVTTSSGYITHRLTGQFRDTAANYEGPWPIDKDNGCWSKDPEVLTHFNIPREQLFELCDPGDILGQITAEAAAETGLLEGLPVVATANDKAVEALGSGLRNDQTALLSLGTYIGGMVCGDTNKTDARSFFANMAAIPGQYLYECQGIRHGMGTISWFVSLLGQEFAETLAQKGEKAEEILGKEATAILPGSDGLVCLPEWLAPTDQPYKRGVMLGFHGGHTRAHIFRALLEATAMSMHNNFRAMCDELDLELQALLVSGGGSQSDLMMQILADVTGIPTRRNQLTDAAALGAAICTAVALEQYSSYTDAIEAMVKPGDEFNPDPRNTDFYRRLNQEVFATIGGQTDPILSRSHELFEQTTNS